MCFTHKPFSANTRSIVSTMVCVCDSISMLTVLPTSFPSKTVCRMVSGMSHTLNRPGLVSPTVSEHPSTDTNPLGKMYLLHFASSSNTTLRLFSVSSRQEAVHSSHTLCCFISFTTSTGQKKKHKHAFTAVESNLSRASIRVRIE